MRTNALKIAGLLYVVAVAQFFVFELVAETLYPGYSVARNYISDLGATCVHPPSTLHCVVHQPAAWIFDVTVFLLGLLLLVGAFFVYQGTRRKLYCLTSAVAAIAILLTGVFPENTGWIHAIDGDVLFYSLGISLLLAWTITRSAVIRYLAVASGALTLFFTVSNLPAELVGAGGQERLLVLSALLGLLAVGGYLVGQDSPTPAAEAREPRSLRRWVLAAIAATITTFGLFAIAIGVGFVVPLTNVEIPGALLGLLSSLIQFLFAASIILWVLTAARWLPRR